MANWSLASIARCLKRACAKRPAKRARAGKRRAKPARVAERGDQICSCRDKQRPALRRLLSARI